MKTPLILFLSFALSFAANAAVTILEDNWDDIGAGFTDGKANGLGTGNNAAKTTPVADPTGSGRGNVGSVNIGDPTGTSPWGELRAPWPGSIDLPSTAVAGVDTMTLKADLYIPSGTTFDTDTAGNGAADRFNMIVRWNGINQGAANKKWNWDSLAADTWHSLEFNTLIKENDNNGDLTTSIIPIFSFYDRSNNATPGVAAYIDNVSISTTTSAAIPEPGVGVLALLGSLIFLRRRRR